ncbi:hypothetical protein ACMDCR_04085 [Labrys okinawensis]|uniref:hypothetical protein n=1 Tax=Labrys okinawensis TaxID=346911 RepID=UPI0039BCCACE
MGQTPDMRFYSPWTVREGARGFQVVDATGFPLFYVPFEDEAARAIAEKRMSKKQAQAMTSKILQMMNTLEQFQRAVDKQAGSERLNQPIRSPLTSPNGGVHRPATA